ncbi:uncharacterized protein J4E87_005078 [Alternaria ethzedia]|uniref:uncharacterized protein n=1 Tax=Alternaria ethzedia TaxID=181014 RepID=UPI0020C44953|nr:uncharacterized protein J4E87_005078 [Alternaria ethzedia]KAI4625232.1 hypothetical protein J4E87_005078 [Alternaria ethzedia]
MAIYLFKLIRRKLREREAQKHVPTTDDSHLVPEPAPGQELQDLSTGHHHGPSQDATGSHINFLIPEETARQKAEARQRNIRQWKLMLGLVLPNFLAAMDVTIVAPAIPLISTHFDQLSGTFNWIVAAYTLTFTTFIPASGQLADIYGRHFALQFQMFWITIGSIICATAQSWSMLLAGRALQGLGAAGIMSLSRIIVSDGATLAETSRSTSILSLISGCSYAVGPVIGGYLADASWRYIFVLPIGVAVLSILIIFFVMRKELFHGRASVSPGQSRRLGYISGLAIIDWPGLVMFIFGVGCIILAIQWGGTQYSWGSAPVIAPLVVGIVLCIAFFTYEYLLGPDRAVARLFHRQIPMIPSTLFRKKDTALLMTINFSAGVSMVCAFYFISYYWQFAEGYSSSQAGVQLLYYTPGLGVGVFIAARLCNQWLRQTFVPLLIGSVVEAVGLALLTYAVSIRHVTMVKVFLAVSGAGTGLRFMPIVLHAAGIWSTRVPSMQSLLSFMLPLGETVGIAMMGSVFSNKLTTFLAAIDNSGSGIELPATGAHSLDLLNSLPPAVKEEVQHAAAKAVMWSLISIMPFMAAAIVASCFLGNVWIGKTAEKSEEIDGQEHKPAQEAEVGKVLYGVYVVAWFMGRLEKQKQDLDVNMEGDEMNRGHHKVVEGDRV